MSSTRSRPGFPTAETTCQHCDRWQPVGYTCEMALTTREELRTMYREAQGGAVDKVIHQLDEHCADFLARSPFMVLSTADAQGHVDGSPKGGAPGFARVLDDGRVAWADSSGNNRLDSFENVVQNDRVAMLFMIPGLDETLRINGTAELSTDSELCQQFAFKDRPAKVVAVVSVAEAYIHCAKAFRRASLWEPESWEPAEDLPSGVQMLKDHAALDMPVEDLGHWYEKDAAETLWAPGGD